MSGHSKWHSIKHKKAVVDARRGQHFTKLARAISVAAREGGGDPEGNSALALAIQKARDASMPKDNIERAIAKGTGEGGDADQIETVVYEGYGPGGVAMLIEALTDNRNRTGADVRHALSKHGGNLGEPGSVAYLFDKRGVIVVSATRYDEDDLIVAIDAGAQDIALAVAVAGCGSSAAPGVQLAPSAGATAASVTPTTASSSASATTSSASTAAAPVPTALKTKPQVVPPSGPPPKKLIVKDLVKG